ncbi:MAG: 2-hydroxychromene-2-carboxylate isomerase [Yoonia sp.]|jgi:2-hydroxychromene-2-carboxylate isomerase|uniref:2-hydroxychromene-2-carboxylate isomerase n=1 Tax=Yoonia sp. TaxID=2212373 RepID=UPI0027402651|nr:2-hydroxychromene-2-carboxylate isomerase [Yoonia sp.]MDP5084608.1 2-hydroxychromene-2-carboxylate isomerase [Yoonia sp.]
MPHIDYYFATLSPFTYLSGTRPAEIAAKHGATISYKPLDIMALFARTGGIPPKDRHPNRQAYRLQELARRSKLLGLPLNPKPMYWPTNGAPSAYAIIAAQNTGGDVAALVRAFGAACWAEERDISQDDVVRDCLEKSGFDPALADKDMLTSADTFAKNLEDAVSAGAFGAPFFITDTDQRFWGEDRIDDLDMYLSGKL